MTAAVGKCHRAQGARLTTCTTAARVAVLQPRDSERPPYREDSFLMETEYAHYS